MLGIFRRHQKHCDHRKDGRKYRRCRCPVWLDGHLDGVEIHKSLGTRDWQKAQRIVRQWEAGEKRDADPSAITLQEASDKFLSDAAARNLGPATLYKYRLLFRQLKEFSEVRGLRFVREFDVAKLSEFRALWRDRNLGALKKLERLSTFFRFAFERKWVEENPARLLKKPKVNARPTMPFSQEEMIQILATVGRYTDRWGRAGHENAKRLRALILLLRYSGMRIGDAVTLSTDRISGNKACLYTQKTGVVVSCVLPDFVVEALEATPRMSDQYFFWTGQSKSHTVVGSWQRALRRLFRLAGVAGAHPHRFRDSFAVELLQAGVPMDRVSVLLGHSSVRVTEKHYAPWTTSRQAQLESDLARAWSRDPIVLLHTKGTQELRGKTGPVN